MSEDASGFGLELERARALCDLRRFDEAISLLHVLLGREPDSAEGWCLLGQAQLGVGRPHEALEAAGRAAALEPEWDWPHRLRSVSFEDLGVGESAIAAAREAVRVGPYSWLAHVRLAGALIRDKGPKPPTATGMVRLDEAQAAAARGVELAPNEPDAHYTLGLVAAARGSHWEADNHFRAALALDPEHGPSHNAIATRRLASSSRLDAGTLADAAAGFRNVVQADPRAHYGAKNLELVFRVFISRLSYLILVIAFAAARSGDPSGGIFAGDAVAARVVPLVLLVIPVGYAAYFLVELEPDLRRHLLYVASHGRFAVASIAQVCALGFLVAAGAAPAHFLPGLEIAAFLSALIARIVVTDHFGAWWNNFRRR